jgi:membrane fusion protein, macrolide-specific efflux system
MKDKKQLKSRKKILIAIVVLLILLITLYFFVFNKKEVAEPTTQNVQRMDISEIVKATGEVYATEIVDVGAQVSGQVQKLYIKLGQDVKKGELLAEIDSTTQLNKLNNDKAELESTKASLVAKKITLKTAKQRYERKLKLYKSDAGSKEELEEAEDQYQQAVADVDSMVYKIKQLQISVNTAQTELGYTQIRSPLSGTIVSLPVEAGQTINFSQTTPLIAKIANLDRMEIRMQIAEGDYTKLKVGLPVKYSTLSDPNIKREDKVHSIDPALTTLTKGTYDSNNENANSAVFYYARMIVENLDRKLSIGMTTQNDVIIHRKNKVLAVPKSVVMGEGDQTTVYVYGANKKIETRKVKTGISDFNNIEIISGLKEGEKVVMELPEGEASSALTAGS